ncbi:hypothetical protein [Achromobacter sp.]|uniref:hypothetical protein n=1 Tax=Achromobacter sp. TaxID=134375 RepID=UPI0028AF414B|nr:hypothetical protein [Achromobacter sp.]
MEKFIGKPFAAGPNDRMDVAELDNCITVYRHVKDEHKPVEIHIQKIRKKFVGRVGMVELHYDRVTGQYRDYAHFQRPPVYSLQNRGAA